MPENMNEMPDIYKQFSHPSYRVYRKKFDSHLGVYEEVLYSTYTGTIEPDDITESPLTKKEGIAFIQHFHPEMKKGTLDKLVKMYGLQKHKMRGYNGYFYIRAEVRAAIKELLNGN